MSIYLIYPNGDEVEHDLSIFSPDCVENGYTPLNPDVWNSLEDGNKIILFIDKEILLSNYRTMAKDLNMVTDSVIFDVYLSKVFSPDSQLKVVSKYIMENTTSLEIRTSNIADLRKIPRQLKELRLYDCDNLKSLDGCPSDLDTLDIFRCRSIRTLSGCPNVKNLFLESCKITSIEHCPTSVTNLSITMCRRLKSLKGCPETPNKIDITYCQSLESLAHFPQNISDHFNIAGCIGLSNLIGCPPDITSLNLTSCTGLTSLHGCPSGVKLINLFDCTGLSNIDDCPNLTKIVNIPVQCIFKKIGTKDSSGNHTFIVEFPPC